MQIIIDAGDSPATLALARRMLDLIEGAPSSAQISLNLQGYKMPEEGIQTGPFPEPGAAHDRLMEGRELPPNLTPPPPPVVGPAAPALPATSIGGVPELDAQRLPWDERIHSSSREKVKDGTWKMKRGVADDLVASVRLQNRALFPLAPAVTVPPAPGQPHAPVAPPPPPAAVVVPPAPPPPPAPSAAPGTVTWIQLMGRLTDLQKAGKLDAEAMNKLAAAYGVDKFQKLALHEQHWASIYETLGAYLDA